jgi:nicotinamidase-related amidase
MPQIDAQPYAFKFDPAAAALVIIDMQRDFLEPGGFGAALGNDVALLRTAIVPTGRVLRACRAAGVMVVHTREGHRADLSDLAPAKRARGNLATGIGDPGPMGRILVRGEPGHDIIPELAPVQGEPVVDKPGKGAFYATDLEAMLRGRGITSFWSAASPPRSASTPPCARPTTAASTASCWRTAPVRTSPNSRPPGSR